MDAQDAAFGTLYSVVIGEDIDVCLKEHTDSWVELCRRPEILSGIQMGAGRDQRRPRDPQVAARL